MWLYSYSQGGTRLHSLALLEMNIGPRLLTCAIADPA